MQGLRRGVTHRLVELRRCLAVGRTAGDRGAFSTCVAAACWRGGNRHVLRLATSHALASGKREGIASLPRAAVVFASRR